MSENRPIATSSGAPVAFRAALGLAAAFMILVAWDQSYWWRTIEDYSFGWLVPVFTAYVVYERWPKILVRLQASASGVPSPRWVRRTLGVLAVAGLAGGAAFFLLGVFYRAGAGPTPAGTFALTVGMVAIVLPLLYFNAPAPDAAAAATVAPSGWRGLTADGRFRVAAVFLFPVLVWMISAPLLGVVEREVNLFLLHKVVSVVGFVFDMLGFPIEQQGNVLLLPKGAVGVADACSGIRSLTACLFAGSFLGATFFEEGWKKVVLVGASMVFAFIMNLGRSLFLTSWAYAYGPEAMEGRVHDTAGYAVLALTCVGLLALVPLLNLKLASLVEKADSSPE